MENNMKKFSAQGKTKLIEGPISMPELAGLRLVVVPASESGKPEGEVYDVLDKKWKNVKAEFKGWFANHWDFKLGSLHSTFVQSDTCVVHMLCYTAKNELSEKGLALAMKNLSALALSDKASVHMSAKILTSMPQVEDLIRTWLIEKGVNVFFYQDPVKVEAKVDSVGNVVMTPTQEEPVKIPEAVESVKTAPKQAPKQVTKAQPQKQAAKAQPKKVSKKLVKKISKTVKAPEVTTNVGLSESDVVSVEAVTVSTALK